MNWVNQYVKPYLEIIIMIAVGHDINPGDELAKHLLPAMEAPYQGLKRIDLWYINVVTPLQLSWLQVSHPPSAGQFVEQTYSNISLDYALLINSSNVIVQDGDIGYTNLLDGLVDDFISAIEKIGLFNDQGLIYIGATGWPITSGRRDDD
ncbi:glucan endo-1,3-beta-glucosidase-like [Manihot esculenta]|uniref:glucan endo-1,3-beta-glucosidase-like n=1 Tax=Manihot esculenta TaxID=3983 RepID=UPI000B5D71F8|nr:glucan endo-1,3-beta-glucosidase-like [Manihot esculenta]